MVFGLVVVGYLVGFGLVVTLGKRVEILLGAGGFGGEAIWDVFGQGDKYAECSGILDDDVMHSSGGTLQRDADVCGDNSILVAHGIWFG